jgi:gamma-glutamyltranspeptidase/glutathione hydrolase
MHMEKESAEEKRRSGRRLRLMLVCVAILSLSCSAKQRTEHVDLTSEPPGLVVSSHSAASRAGMEVLRSGGNAVDAAVATGLALGVVDQFNSGIGGGGFILLRLNDGTVFAIDGREKAPAAASRGMFVRGGRYDETMSRVGPLAVGVPGMLAAYEKALAVAGSRSLEELIQPAVELAEQGVILDGYALSRYRKAIETLARDHASAQIYLHEDGSQLVEGERLKQPDLAETYRRIGEGGSDYFYRGAFARRLASYMAEKGGWITLADMESYRAVVREPVVGTYRNFTVFGMPPPSSGGVHVLQILNMVEAAGTLDGRSGWDEDSILWTSRFMARAFQDRAAHLGDSDFFPVPLKRLTDKAYAEEIVAGLMKEAPTAGSDAEGVAPSAGGHTTAYVVLDRDRNVVVVNQTVNLSYGAKITLPGTGVLLNNEMDDFSAQPGKPNAFGLVGSEANAIEPGKRPLSSMSPTIIVRGSKPVMALAGAGGPTIITAVLQVILNVLDFEMDLARAMSLPRFHHQYLPDLLIVEKDSPLAGQLTGGVKGPKVMVRDTIGILNAIAWSEKEKAYVGVSDPRARESKASLRLGDQGP